MSAISASSIPFSPANVPNRGRIPSLDGIRAISIVLVLVGHTARAGGAPRSLAHFTHMGNIGVRFFFVLSGFLITQLLLRESSASGTISLAQFYKRRALRILPASLAFIGAVALLQTFGIIRLLPGDLPHALTYTMDYSVRNSWWVDHLWSLSVEEQFYLLWPGIMLILGIRRSFRAAWAVVATAPVIRAVIWYGPRLTFDMRRQIVTHQFQAVADSIAVGCLLAGYFSRLSSNSTYLRLQRKVWFLPLTLFAILLGNALYVVHPGLFYIIGQSVANVGIVFCIDYCIRQSETFSGKILNWGPIAWLGTLSYSLYLWQNPFLNQDLVTRLTSYPLNIVLAFGMAALSYYLVERPALRLKEARKATYVSAGAR